MSDKPQRIYDEAVSYCVKIQLLIDLVGRWG
jgi:hypothetical protein